ncbi:hypothetical protein [Tabrizicola sp.]|uniref:hypothetical protein n=1 Tax=Tabrizicola sp. TaxID=2005166 RepID=UPI003F680CA9
MRLEARGRSAIEARLPELQKLDCFHSLYFGEFGHCPDWRSPGNVFHSDAPAAIVVNRKGKVSGVLGIEVLGSTLLVRQLQGAPKANFHDGTRAEAYLLDCAEQIADAMKMRTLRIVDAETAIAFREAAPPADRPSEEAKAHMRRNYSYPEKAGYGKSYFWRLRRATYVRPVAKRGASQVEAAPARVESSA